jgi:large subunit ribosomal protein L29
MAKNTVKAADVRAKTDKELETRLAELRKEKFNLRFQRATGQLANTARTNHVRKEIAKIMTIIGERKRGAKVPAVKTKKTAAKKSAA